MAHDETAASGAPAKLVIKNIGLMLSGDLAMPILDADAIIAVNGRIAGIGRAADLDFSGATTTIDAHGVAIAPGLIDSHVHPVAGDWTPRQNQLGWIDSCLHGGVTTMISAGRGAHARPAPRHRRPQGVGDHCAALLFRIFAPSGVKVHAGAPVIEPGMEEHDFQELAAAGVKLPRRGRPRRSQGRPHRPQDGRLGAQIRPQQHHPYRRPVDPRLRPHRQGHRARGRYRRDRPYQRRPYGAAGRSDRLPLRRLQARPRTRPQRQ